MTKNLSANALLLVALVLPVALFLGLLSRALAGVPVAAVSAVAAGWGLNVAWAQAAAGQDPGFVMIAKRFGWACPAVLVLLSWLVWRFALGHPA